LSYLLSFEYFENFVLIFLSFWEIDVIKGILANQINYKISLISISFFITFIISLTFYYILQTRYIFQFDQVAVFRYRFYHLTCIKINADQLFLEMIKHSFLLIDVTQIKETCNITNNRTYTICTFLVYDIKEIKEIRTYRKMIS